MLPAIISRPVSCGLSITANGVYARASADIYDFRVKTSYWRCHQFISMFAVRFMELSRHPMKVLPSMILLVFTLA